MRTSGAYDALIGKDVDYASEAAPAPTKTKYIVEFVVEADAPLASYQLKEIQAKIEKIAVGEISDIKIAEEGAETVAVEAPKKEEPAEPAKEMGLFQLLQVRVLHLSSQSLVVTT